MIRAPARFLTPALILAALAACMGTEAKVRRGLINAGLSPAMAGCMAEPMARKLSLAQLMRLRSLGKVRETETGKEGTERFLHRLRALNDPEIIAVTGAAAFDCILR